MALVPAVVRFAQQLPATPPEPSAAEYENVLVQVGYEPGEARFLSTVAIYYGEEFASE
jgi:hypothetical protein